MKDIKNLYLGVEEIEGYTRKTQADYEAYVKKFEDKRLADKKLGQKTPAGDKPPPPKEDVIPAVVIDEVVDEVTELPEARKASEKFKRGDGSPLPVSTEKQKKAKFNPDDKSDSDSINSISALNVSDSDYDPNLAVDPLEVEM